mgnify:CR=1 FL=1
MKAVEKYIREHTEEGGNPIIDWDGNIAIYQPWLTPSSAREVAQIAREETIKEVCEWLNDHTLLSEKWYIEDLKKHLEHG